VSSTARPVKELKGFQRVTLAAGEARNVEFTLKARDLGAYDWQMRYTVEPGPFRLWAGPSSAEGLQLDFHIVR